MIACAVMPITPDFGALIHYTGHLHDEVSLRIHYSADGVIIVPSRLEVFGQTASAVHSCRMPVVAFDISGLRDIIDHEVISCLAKTFGRLI